MSPLWLVITLETALAISFGSLTSSTPAAPAYVAGLEKAAQEQLEKYEQKVEQIAAEETTQEKNSVKANILSRNERVVPEVGVAAVPEEIAELEKAVQEKFGGETQGTSAPVEEPKRQYKKVSMHDMPHYRNHGAAMYHVEPKEAKASSRITAEKATQATELAEKRAEVENIFHLSHQGGVERYATAPAEKPVGAGRQLMRFVFSLSAVFTIFGIAYHKYEVICHIASGKHGPQKTKSKCDYIDDFGSKFA